MPIGPKGQKRHADVIKNAVQVMRIATGDDDDSMAPRARVKNPAAVLLGRKGGEARAKAISGAKRRKIAVLAAKARWKAE